MIFDLTKRKGGGGEWTTDGIAANTEPSGDIEIGVATIAARAIDGKPITTVRSETVTTIEEYGLAYNTNLTSVYFPYASVGQYSFINNTYMTEAVVSGCASYKAGSFSGCTRLQTVDMTGLTSAGRYITGQTFTACAALDTIILRHSSIVTLQNANGFTNTKFASGGTGGTIYIPKSLYDHLGDGTANDYKAATNWSTIDGYGTITWKSIESTHTDPNAPIDLTLYYADGTPIPTE